MNFSASVTCLFLYFVCISSPVLAADDIFATPAPTPTMEQRYPTAAAFLAATRSGEIPEFLRKNHDGWNGTMLGSAAIHILVKESGLNSMYIHPGPHTAMCGIMIQSLTDHAFNASDKDAIWEFQQTQQNMPADLREVFNKFAVQYDNAMKEYVAKVRQKENQVAEERSKHDSDVDKAKESRKKKLADVLASPAYAQWESASQVQQGEELISNAQHVLDHDDAVKRESGVTDLAARRAAGEQMVAGKSLVETAFDAYKKQGGKAAAPKDVVAGPDPAAAYR